MAESSKGEALPLKPLRAERRLRVGLNMSVIIINWVSRLNLAGTRSILLDDSLDDPPSFLKLLRLALGPEFLQIGRRIDRLDHQQEDFDELRDAAREGGQFGGLLVCPAEAQHGLQHFLLGLPFEGGRLLQAVVILAPKLRMLHIRRQVKFDSLPLIALVNPPAPVKKQFARQGGPALNGRSFGPEGRLVAGLAVGHP